MLGRTRSRSFTRGSGDGVSRRRTTAFPRRTDAITATDACRGRTPPTPVSSARTRRRTPTSAPRRVAPSRAPSARRGRDDGRRRLHRGGSPRSRTPSARRERDDDRRRLHRGGSPPPAPRQLGAGAVRRTKSMYASAVSSGTIARSTTSSVAAVYASSAPLSSVTSRIVVSAASTPIRAKLAA